MSKSLKLRIKQNSVQIAIYQCGRIGPKPSDCKPPRWEWEEISLDDPQGYERSMGLGSLQIHRLPDAVRIIRFSSRGNINFCEDLKADGTYQISPHFVYQEEDIDPQKAATENWEPWETHRDYIEKLQKDPL